MYLYTHFLDTVLEDLPWSYFFPDAASLDAQAWCAPPEALNKALMCGLEGLERGVGDAGGRGVVDPEVRTVSISAAAAADLRVCCVLCGRRSFTRSWGKCGSSECILGYQERYQGEEQHGEGGNNSRIYTGEDRTYKTVDLTRPTKYLVKQSSNGPSMSKTSAYSNLQQRTESSRRSNLGAYLHIKSQWESTRTSMQHPASDLIG
jgi:hypothetical protein